MPFVVYAGPRTADDLCTPLGRGLRFGAHFQCGLAARQVKASSAHHDTPFVGHALRQDLARAVRWRPFLI